MKLFLNGFCNNKIFLRFSQKFIKAMSDERNCESPHLSSRFARSAAQGSKAGTPVGKPAGEYSGKEASRPGENSG
jgi:hypothetical protein